MRQIKVTPWFKPSQTPARIGLYQVESLFYSGLAWAYWDGKKWGFQCDTKKEAFYYRHWESGIQNKTWRGLTHE